MEGINSVQTVYRDSHYRGLHIYVFIVTCLSSSGLSLFLPTYLCLPTSLNNGQRRSSSRVQLITTPPTAPPHFPFIHLSISYNKPCLMKTFQPLVMYKRNTKSVGHFSPCDFCRLLYIYSTDTATRNRQVSVGLKLPLRATLSTTQDRNRILHCLVTYYTVRDII
jgi:hypothetical protein